MKVYKPIGSEGSELCHPANHDNFETIKRFVGGGSCSSGWEPINVEIIREDEGKRLRLSDSPWLGSHSLIFGTRAVDALGPLLSANGDLLPLDCAERPLFLYNARLAAGALDVDESVVNRFKSGRIMWIKQHVFHHDAIAGFDAFKITDLLVSPTFVTERFVRAWEAAGLVGLDFNEIWRSE